MNQGEGGSYIRKVSFRSNVLLTHHLGGSLDRTTPQLAATLLCPPRRNPGALPVRGRCLGACSSCDKPHIWLQWDTTEAGTFAYYRIHPVGLGCRTIGLLMSDVPQHGVISPPFKTRTSLPTGCWLQSSQEGRAILRRLWKALAVISGLGIPVVSLTQHFQQPFMFEHDA